MGANCCVAMRGNPLPDDPRIEIPACRNFRCSPSWSFRWDNRTHIEDIMDNSARFARRGGGDAGFEFKSWAETESEGFSNEGSPVDSFVKSRVDTRSTGKGSDGAADQSIGSNLSHEEKRTTESTGYASASDTNPSLSVLSTPSSSAFNLDLQSSKTCTLPSDPTSSRQARRSPGYQLSRQVSDSRIPSLKSLNEYSSPEGAQSSVLSISGNDLSMAGSHGGSSDGWSMRTFTELVASSQRYRWSFDSENPISVESKLARSNTQPLPSVSANMQTCGVCSKLLKERSPWSTQKIVSTNDLSVVSVLVCGHVAHAECLESVTSETDRFEPPCPICNIGDTSAMKLFREEMNARSKLSRIAVGDADEGFGPVPVCLNEGRKGTQIGASSSMKSYFGRSFLKRHFSSGSRLIRPPVQENETSRKKGFWARNWRD